MLQQSIRYASVKEHTVAWAAVGNGPPLIFGGWWMSHLELDWGQPRFRAFVGELAEHRTVIRYDRPSSGMSADGNPPFERMGDEVEVLATVIDAVGPGPVDILAVSAGSMVALAYAADRPERVGHLVLFGAYSSGAAITDEDGRRALLGMVRSSWGISARMMADLLIPSATAEEREAFAAFKRESAGAEEAAAWLEVFFGFDASDRLAELDRPVHVLHRKGDRAVSVALGRDLASKLPQGRFVALEGQDHLPWHGDWSAVVRETLNALEVPDQSALVQTPGPDGVEVDIEAELSPRELEVLRLVAAGLSDQEIATELSLSPHTVHRHVANIRTKLRLSSRAAAAALAARAGLL